MTIMEESKELAGRLKAGGPFPMFTSCCPAWINLVEKKYPELIPHLSTSNSPIAMIGPMIKVIEYCAFSYLNSDVLRKEVTQTARGYFPSLHYSLYSEKR